MHFTVARLVPPRSKLTAISLETRKDECRNRGVRSAGEGEVGVCVVQGLVQRARVDVPYVVVGALLVRGDKPSSVRRELDGLGGRLRGLEDVQRLERVCVLKPDCAVVGPGGDHVAARGPCTADDQAGVPCEHHTRNAAEVPNHNVRELERVFEIPIF